MGIPITRYALRFAALAAIALTTTACVNTGPTATADPGLQPDVATAVEHVVQAVETPETPQTETPATPTPVVGCAGHTVGVAMPNQNSERWMVDGLNIKEQLETRGCVVNLQFANDDVATQQAQIADIVATGADVLIVAPVDAGEIAIAAEVESAAGQGIPIISYDRLVPAPATVDFLVTFDYAQAGGQQANSLLTGLGLLDANGNRTAETGPKTIELFSGPLPDDNARRVWIGAMDTLQPFIDDGTLVVGSGQVDRVETATTPADAQARMAELIAAHYGNGSGLLAGVLAPDDATARGIISALHDAGYGPTIAAGMPIVTGQDAEIASIQLINDDIQFATVFRDTRNLATAAVVAAAAFATDQTPEPNDAASFDVPTFLLPTELVTRDNVQQVLIDSGFLTAVQLAGPQPEPGADEQATDEGTDPVEIGSTEPAAREGN